MNKAKKRNFGLIILLIVFLFGCFEDEPIDFDGRIYTLYESVDTRTSAKQRSKVSTIQRVGKDHLIARRYINELQSIGFTIDQLDIDSICRIICVGTDVTILTVPLKETSQKIVSYFFRDKYCSFEVTKAQDNWCYKSIDGKPFLTLSAINERIEIEDKVKNDAMEQFSKEVYNISTKSNQSILSLKSTKSESNGTYECCRKAPSVDECVGCSISCYDGAIPSEIMAFVFPISCIGAGPNASC